jgi:uncharacterized OB-fold protein
MNVIEQWRDREQQLRGVCWRCSGCEALSPVRRLVCAACSRQTSFTRAELPRSLTVLAYSHDYATLERPNQFASPAVAVLVQVGNGRMLSLLLCEGDYDLAPHIVGQQVEPELRRLAWPGGTDEPIEYGIKAVAGFGARETVCRNLGAGKTKRD